MWYHMLTGDAMAPAFRCAPISGEVLISRECFIEGPVEGDSLQALWQTRSDYLTNAYGINDKEYRKCVASSYEKLLSLKSEDTLCLWFEHDLFCQINYWFCLYLLKKNGFEGKVYRVFPCPTSEDSLWLGYGKMEAKKLVECFEHKVAITLADIDFGANLWHHFQTKSYHFFEQVKIQDRSAFPHLDTSLQALLDWKQAHYPENLLKTFLAEGLTDFHRIFARFSHIAGRYGFGDTQVKRILAEIV